MYENGRERSGSFNAISPFPLSLTIGDGLDRQGADSDYDNRCSTHFPTERNPQDRKVCLI